MRETDVRQLARLFHPSGRSVDRKEVALGHAPVCVRKTRTVAEANTNVVSSKRSQNLLCRHLRDTTVSHKVSTCLPGGYTTPPSCMRLARSRSRHAGTRGRCRCWQGCPAAPQHNHHVLSHEMYPRATKSVCGSEWLHTGRQTKSVVCVGRHLVDVEPATTHNSPQIIVFPSDCPTTDH